MPALLQTGAPVQGLVREDGKKRIFRNCRQKGLNRRIDVNFNVSEAERV
jgi:hypothetical protein